MWANSSVNVRDLPSEDGSKIDVLSKAQEVHITGQCLETDWYRMEYNGGTAYVSNGYLQDSKLEIETSIFMPEESEQTASIQPATSSEQASVTNHAQDEVCPYELYVIYYDNQGYPYYYGKWGGSANMDADNYAKTENCGDQMSRYMSENFSVWNEEHTGKRVSSTTSWQLIGTYQGMSVVVRYIGIYTEAP